MIGLLDSFAIEEALSKFNRLDLNSSALGLLKSMGYPIKWPYAGKNDTLEDFIYFTAQNKMHFNKQEMYCLDHVGMVSCILEMCQSDFSDKSYRDGKIIFLAIDLRSPTRDRSYDAYYITKILNKTYDGFIVFIYHNHNAIMLCTCLEDGTCICMSDWINYQNIDFNKLLGLLPACYCFSSEGTIENFYDDLSYGIAREYIKYPESKEHIAYQCIPNVEAEIGDDPITWQRIKDLAEQSKDYYKNNYGDDYIEVDENFEVMEAENEEWVLLELEGFTPLDIEIEDEEELSFLEDNEQINYSEMAKEIIEDPIQVLRWLKDREAY